MVFSMLWSFQASLDDEHFSLLIKDGEYKEKYQRGLDLFSRYFDNLWF